MAAAVLVTQLPAETSPKTMGIKRVFAHLGDGSLFAGTTPRKRPRYFGPTSVRPPPSTSTTTRRRVLRARRTPVKMELVPPDRKRASSSLSSPSPKRYRPSPKPTIPTPPPRKFHTAEMRAAAARKMSREAPPARNSEPMRMEEVEIEADGAGTVPPRTHIPPPPAVHAAMLEDGRVAVRIVRENGLMQAVVIDPPEWY